MKLAKLEEEEKNRYFFLSFPFFILFYSSNKMAHIHQKRKEREEYFHCKKVRHTHTLFKLDNEAWMNDQHEMMINFYYTNQYLEMLMDYPKRKKTFSSFCFVSKFKPVEFQKRKVVKIVHNQQLSMDNVFDWIRYYLFHLLMFLVFHIDKVFQLMFDKNFSSLHYMVKEQVIKLFVIVFLVFDIWLVDFETKPFEE